MPGLVAFNHRWLIASDDLVIPCAFEVLLRLSWILATGIFIGMNFQNTQICRRVEFIQYYLYALLSSLVFTSCVTGAIAWLSAQGSVMQVRKRKFLPKFIYMKLAATLLDLFLACIGIWLSFICEDLLTCLPIEINVFIKVTTICMWSFICIMLLGIGFSYNPLSSYKYQKQKRFIGNRNESDLTKKLSIKAKRVWEYRLKALFCCVGMNEEIQPIYQEISTFLASLSLNAELAFTDILAGLIIMSKRQTCKLRNVTHLNSECPNFKEKILVNAATPLWMTTNNASHFLRLAKGTYGWPLFLDFKNPCNVCVLAANLKCCGSCFSPSDAIDADNCCYCNSAALQRATGIAETDIIYVSYQNSVYEVPFYVAVDHQTTSIVIAIRGTLSLTDLLTDFTVESESFCIEGWSHNFSCHRGVLLSALFISKKLVDLKILKTAFSEFSDYTLVLTGHSLGGSIASILAFLLRPEYPFLQCYAFAPLAVLSSTGIKHSLDFIFSIVIGDDLVPQLCVQSCEKLRIEIIECLEECRMPKYKVLLGVCCDRMCWKQSFSQWQSEQELFEYEKDLQCDFNSSVKFDEQQPSSQLHLYAPGRILHIRKVLSKYTVKWTTGFDFDHLIVTPNIVIDHQPHTIQKMLDEINFPSNSSQDIHSSSSTSEQNAENTYLENNYEIV